MRPTLKPGDKLFVASGGDVRVGDVVVFRLDEKLHIAHRVVSVDSRGIITRGDNAHSHDARILQPYDITGKVISAQRGTRNRVIRDGIDGILYARTLWAIKHFTNLFVCLFSPVYQALSISGIFRRMLPARARPRIVFFNSKGGVERQLLLGRLVIGRRIAGSDKWQLRPPFRLFVDESMLP